jgi:hypothetical protein
VKVPHYWRKQKQRYQLTGAHDQNGKASIVKRQVVVTQHSDVDKQDVVVTTAA